MQARCKALSRNEQKYSHSTCRQIVSRCITQYGPQHYCNVNTNININIDIEPSYKHMVGRRKSYSLSELLLNLLIDKFVFSRTLCFKHTSCNESGSEGYSTSCCEGTSWEYTTVTSVAQQLQDQRILTVVQPELPVQHAQYCWKS